MNEQIVWKCLMDLAALAGQSAEDAEVDFELIDTEEDCKRMQDILDTIQGEINENSITDRQRIQKGE
jgi:hypothetical protein